jgi:hypothetical protein
VGHPGRVASTVSIDLTADELDLLRRALVELTADIDHRLTEGLRGRHREQRHASHEADREAARRLAVRLMELPRPS